MPAVDALRNHLEVIATKENITDVPDLVSLGSWQQQDRHPAADIFGLDPALYQCG
jgi:hypothetical protein